jgi:AAA domain
MENYYVDDNGAIIKDGRVTYAPTGWAFRTVLDRLAEAKRQEKKARKREEKEKERLRREPLPPPPLPPIPAVDIALDPIPKRDWAVPERIPAKNVTLLSGEGAVGKSVLLLQLSTATVMATDWIKSLPEPMARASQLLTRKR